MRSKKLCYILLSALFIMFGLSLNDYSDTSALKHDYNGITLMRPSLPVHFITDSNGRSSIDWDYNYSTFMDFLSLPSSNVFSLDLVTSDPPSALSTSMTYFNPYPVGTSPNFTSCSIGTTSAQPILRSNSSTSFVSASYFNYFPDRINDFYINDANNIHSSVCRRRSAFGSGSQLPWDGNTPSAFYSSDEGFSTGVFGFNSLINVPNYSIMQRLMLPDYWFSTDGFYVHSTAIDTSSGIHYNHSFSFNDLFNQPVRDFSRLNLNLFGYNDYFLDSSNFYQGRHLEWRGVFEFDGTFEWNSFIDSTTDDYFRVRVFYNFRKQGTSNTWDTVDFPCVANVRTVPDLSVTWLEYSCSGDLPDDSPYIYPVLQIYSGDSNEAVWHTDADWRFGNQFLVTDYDETEGESFNSDLHGNNIPGDAKNYISDSTDNADWYSSLINLFNFNMINPFAPIFSLFTSQDSCAQIPTLSEFLHSEETQVCPFFSSRIRSVVTPVLGLSAMMLVFGFAVRWLGARSGNFFEDSGSIAPPGDFPAGSAGVKHVGWRRK